MNSEKPKRRAKLEIKFDPKSRREYLTGFSSRKKQRRTFGLAMQRVKDRKLKLEQRKEIRQAQLEKMEELEEQREISSAHLLLNQAEGEDEASTSGINSCGNEKNVTKHHVATEKAEAGISSPTEGNEGAGIIQSSSCTSSHQNTEMITTAVDFSLYGGQQVIVRTTFGLPEDSDEEADKNALARREKKSNGVDMEQRHAGSVKRYIAALKGKSGNKLKSSNKKHVARKGKHGASNMAGIGGAANLKMARKTLAKVEKHLKHKGETQAGRRKGSRR
jgi:hypothetical protein